MIMDTKQQKTLLWLIKKMLIFFRLIYNSIKKKRHFKSLSSPDVPCVGFVPSERTAAVQNE